MTQIRLATEEALDTKQGIAAPTYTSTAALQAALDDAAETGSTVVVGDSTLDNVTTGVTVPVGAVFVCRGLLTFPASFSGVGVLFDGHTGTSGHIIKVARTSAAWDTGGDTTSVGVKFKNCTWVKADIRKCLKFHDGINMVGDGYGNQDNEIRLGDVRNNKVNLNTTALNGGYVNNNTFQGGQLRHDSGFASYAGTREISFLISNGNSVINVDLEGEAVERTLDIDAPMNGFLLCRWESSTGAWLGADASATALIGGFGLHQMPIHDSTGGDILIVGQGVVSPGRGGAAEGWSIGYAALGVPYVQYEQGAHRYSFLDADDTYADVRLNAITTGDPGFTNGPGKLMVGSPVTASAALDTTRYLEVLLNGAIVKLAIVS